MFTECLLNVQEICTGLTGAYAFAYVDALRKYVLAARSADGIVPLYW
jgi:asparagine synthetase B (glutamine-hydrolysing)